MSDGDDTRFLLGRLVEGQEKMEKLLDHFHQTLTKTVEDHGARLQAIERLESHRKSWLAGVAAAVGAGGAAGWHWLKSLFDG